MRGAFSDVPNSEPDVNRYRIAGLVLDNDVRLYRGFELAVSFAVQNSATKPSRDQGITMSIFGARNWLLEACWDPDTVITTWMQ
ncbi:hypothetical protein VTN00DRAFT_6359 [Thermoascus crustaceus]|uniref:uncharacterized protein n=1 Tax=Thermoascus crustaceus TaxID=5088 RepID=UPI00374379B5